MRLIHCVVLNSFLLTLYNVQVNGYGCVEQLNSCSCKTTVIGWTLDLSPLDYKRTGRALSTNSHSSPTTTFVFNPCSGFRCGTSNDSSVCAKDNRTGSLLVETPIGVQTTARFSRHSSPNTIMLEFPSQQRVQTNHSSKHESDIMTLVEVTCDRTVNTSTFTLLSETRLRAKFEYRFLLRTPLACTESPMDWVLFGLIMLATWVFVWLVVIVGIIGKMICLKCKRDKNGVELAPRIRLANLVGVGPDGENGDDIREPVIALDVNSPPSYKAATRSNGCEKHTSSACIAPPS